VSHFAERKEKSCLNCNAVVQGRFCHICGQENVEPKETLWHLISHFFQDITHFDGKFFGTLRYLLFKPGFLSREYMLGRRASYLNPIRMYVFTSAFFFLFFFSIVKPGNINTGDSTFNAKEKVEKMNTVIKGLREQEAELTDSVVKTAVQKTIDNFSKKAELLEKDLAVSAYADSMLTVKFAARLDSANKERIRQGKDPVRANTRNIFSIDFSSGYYRTVVAYDSVQALLPAEKQDGWWRRLRVRKAIDLIEKTNDKSGGFGKDLIGKFTHSLPQMFFLSLPAFAFVLSLLYRKERKYYFVNHAIFSIHLYCATFIFSFVMILLFKYASFGSKMLENFYNLLFVLLFFFYSYKCMRNFYQQRRAKTIFKFIILNLLSFIVVLLLAIIFFIISLWNV
jgi:Protein of unknown function (DUF3667)